jgi:hypothetical protein
MCTISQWKFSSISRKWIGKYSNDGNDPQVLVDYTYSTSNQ